MRMTVEQALSIYPLSEGKLVAGAAGKHRIVRSINVMDAPDISDWIKEGEMVFTTAYLIKDQPMAASQLLRKLNERGSSGLGVKLGRFWSSIPESLVEEADALGFPIIELPYEFTFSDQMIALFRAEIKRSTEALRSVMEKQRRLMRFALRSDPIVQLFDAVAEMIDCKIAVLNARGKIVFNNSPIPDWELSPDATECRVQRKDWQAYRAPIAGRNRTAGCVFFFVEDPSRMAAEEGLYMQAAELLGFHMDANFQDFYELIGISDRSSSAACGKECRSKSWRIAPARSVSECSKARSDAR
ncbi:PucR family transcriptional regulator ligand-binding domain-containing protein [Paenibacillus antri]|uniref:PucR family transcriptional regulator ligand-binding domain-containing protein n=1 Tax=Paenibacillus antri TaxID=2582848 RepID=UPI001EE43982|nr:PucR family transcriptional regulator ligand-binding domain-containing protein [Paenibacillus antri]